MLTNLDPNTVYDFQVHSRDVAGNQVSSTIDSFATDAAANPPPFSIEWPVSASEMLNEAGVTVTANTTEYAHVPGRLMACPLSRWIGNKARSA